MQGARMLRFPWSSLPLLGRHTREITKYRIASSYLPSFLLVLPPSLSPSRPAGPSPPPPHRIRNAAKRQIHHIQPHIPRLSKISTSGSQVYKGKFSLWRSVGCVVGFFHTGVMASSCPPARPSVLLPLCSSCVWQGCPASAASPPLSPEHLIHLPPPASAPSAY